MATLRCDVPGWLTHSTFNSRRKNYSNVLGRDNKDDSTLRASDKSCWCFEAGYRSGLHRRARRTNSCQSSILLTRSDPQNHSAYLQDTILALYNPCVTFHLCSGTWQVTKEAKWGALAWGIELPAEVSDEGSFILGQILESILNERWTTAPLPFWLRCRFGCQGAQSRRGPFLQNPSILQPDVTTHGYITNTQTPLIFLPR